MRNDTICQDSHRQRMFQEATEIGVVHFFCCRRSLESCGKSVGLFLLPVCFRLVFSFLSAWEDLGIHSGLGAIGGSYHEPPHSLLPYPALVVGAECRVGRVPVVFGHHAARQCRCLQRAGRRPVMTLTWANPPDEDFAGVKIQRKTNGNPLSPSEGTTAGC